MKKHFFCCLAFFSMIVLSCTREYTCECVSYINGIEYKREAYTATGKNEKELCEDADREFYERLDSLDIATQAPYYWEELGLEYPEDTLVTEKRNCTAK